MATQSKVLFSFRHRHNCVIFSEISNYLCYSFHQEPKAYKLEVISIYGLHILIFMCLESKWKKERFNALCVCVCVRVCARAPVFCSPGYIITLCHVNETDILNSDHSKESHHEHYKVKSLRSIPTKSMMMLVSSSSFRPFGGKRNINRVRGIPSTLSKLFLHFRRYPCVSSTMFVTFSLPLMS
jgi:hypothetical protein